MEYQDGEISSLLFRSIAARQVHGADVLVVDGFHTNELTGDGIVTKRVNLPLLVKTADCLPILAVDDSSGIIAAVHAGWQGIYKRILPASIARMEAIGAARANIKVAIGPHIRGCCYHVEKERVKYFLDAGFKAHTISKRRQGKYYLDLEAIARMQLEESGVIPEHIDILPLCTCCNYRFPSYRRTGPGNGSMVSIICRA